MHTVIEAKHIVKTFAAGSIVFPVLHGIDLTIYEGEFVGIMGPSGSGKTTLLNILATIDEPTSGDVLIDGESVLHASEGQLSTFRRTKLGFIFQDYNLLDTLTVRENIVLPLALANTRVDVIEHKVHAVADAFDIRPILDKYPYQISGGQKQRAAASRSIVSSPRLILADEPTGALDSRSATALLEALSTLNQRDQATILLVTHDTFAASYCSRVLFLRDGSIFTELVRGDMLRRTFHTKLLDVLSMVEGGSDDTV